MRPKLIYVLVPTYSRQRPSIPTNSQASKVPVTTVSIETSYGPAIQIETTYQLQEPSDYLKRKLTQLLASPIIITFKLSASTNNHIALNHIIMQKLRLMKYHRSFQSLLRRLYAYALNFSCRSCAFAKQSKAPNISHKHHR